MAMSQSEYLRRLTDNAPRFIARNKTRDSSEQTFIVQARGNTVRPSASMPNLSVANMTIVNGNSNIGYAASRGNGTFNDYTAILQNAQACAVCSDPNPVVNQFVFISSICEDHSKPPFSQQNLSTAYVNYTYGGQVDYFPPKLSATCSTNQIKYPYPSG